MPRGRSTDREKHDPNSPRSERCKLVAEAWFFGVTFLTSLDSKTYDETEMLAALDAFIEEKEMDFWVEISLRSLVASLDIVDAHVRALAGCVEQLKMYSKSPLFLSILRVIGHACMFADLDCGLGNLPGKNNQVEHLRRVSEALVDRCNLAIKTEREWIIQACGRICDAYVLQERELNEKVSHMKKRNNKADGEMDDGIEVAQAGD